MASPYDTPPDGDFARYVEELSRRPSPGQVPRRPPRAPQPQAHGAQPAAFAPVRPVVQGALFVLVVWLMLCAAVPALAAWSALVALAYLVFSFVRLRHLPWRALLQRHR